MSKKTRQWVTILGLFVLLVAAGVGYYAASVHQNKKEKQEAKDEDQITLYAMEQDQICKIHLKTKDRDVTYAKEDSIWKDTSDKNYPVNQDYISDMLNSLATVSASKLVVENPTDLSEYQLDTPAYQIELEDSQGNKNSLAIGLESVAAEGYYAYAGNADKIYTISSNTTDALDYTWGQMMELPEEPDITAAYVTAYSVTPKKGKAFEAVYNEKRAEYKDYDGWDIKKAYAKTMPGSSEALQGLFGGLSSLTCQDGVSYQATKKEKQKYGLDQPAYTIDVSYYTVESDEDGTTDSTSTDETEQKKTEHVYKLYVGSLDSSKENYYVSVEGEKGIYRMSADTIDGLVKIDAFSMLYQKPYAAKVDTLQKIVLTQNGKKHTITFRKEEVKDAIKEDDESTVYNYYVKLDGVDVDQEAFRNTYTSVFGDLLYRGEISNKVKTTDNTPVESIKIQTDDRVLTMKFLPYDGVNFYRIEVDGQCQFLVDKNVADAVFTKLLASEPAKDQTDKE